MPSSQGQVKELQKELEDSRAAQKEVLTSARESERRSKTVEAEILQLHEVMPRGAFVFICRPGQPSDLVRMSSFFLKVEHLMHPISVHT